MRKRPVRCSVIRRYAVMAFAGALMLWGGCNKAYPGEVYSRIAGEDELTIVVAAENIRDEKVERTIRYYLPDGVEPQHLLDMDGFRMKYDPESDRYYLSRTEVFEAKEIKVFNVKVENVWEICERLLSAYLMNAQEINNSLRGSEHEQAARRLYDEIRREGLGIMESQKKARTVSEHIELSSVNKRRFDSLMRRLRSLKELRVPEENVPEARTSSGGVPIRMIIFMISNFTLVITITFFTFWFRAEKKARGKKRPRKKKRNGG